MKGLLSTGLTPSSFFLLHTLHSSHGAVYGHSFRQCVEKVCHKCLTISFILAAPVNEEADEDRDELGDFEPSREGAENLLESSLDTHAEGAGSREQM